MDDRALLSYKANNRAVLLHEVLINYTPRSISVYNGGEIGDFIRFEFDYIAGTPDEDVYDALKVIRNLGGMIVSCNGYRPIIALF